MQGILRELNLDKQVVHYDLILHEHYYFVCEQCGLIENFVNEDLLHMNKEMENIVHGQVTTKELVFDGLCKECLAKNKKALGSQKKER